ncbi:MAG: CvpA family protein [Tissierellales bacterium]|jgi:uncharacterized membrane protein required for colicin V production|nr:CvpA family protein [Tissierellales bacterium]
MTINGLSIVDIMIVVIILVSAVEGLFRGFIVLTLNFLSYIIALVVAKLYYPVLANFMMNSTDLFGDLRKALEKYVGELFSQGGTNHIINGMNLPDGIKEGARAQVQSGMIAQTPSVSHGVVELFFNLVSIILIFVAVKFLIFVVSKILDSAAQLPILKQMNKFAGVIVGGIKGVMLVYVLCLIMTPFVTFAPEGTIAMAINESTLGPTFYYDNLIWKFFNSIGDSVWTF